ncbi:MAG TPA: sugar ABC transporter permease [Chloroflexota bacterium]|nr:sugar ABC transporter permease [Chloroflexota bacterium]
MAELPLPAVRPRPGIRGWLRTSSGERTELVGYLFVAPYLLAFLLFMVVPAIGGLYVSLTNWGGLNVPRLIGLANYAEALNSAIFWQTVRNTVYYTILFVPLVTVCGLVAAVFVHQRFPGYTLARAAFYSPYVMAVTVTGLIWLWLLNQNWGVVNYYLGYLHPYFHTFRPPWLIDAEWAMPSIVVATVWWLVGYQMVILLAGLQEIPDELYEAAKIDGGSPLQNFWHITLPLLRPALTFVLVTNVIGSLRVFGQMFLMTSGGPAGATTSVVLLIYQSAFQNFRLGYSAAVSYLLFLGILVVTVLQLRLMRGNQAA